MRNIFSVIKPFRSILLEKNEKRTLFSRPLKSILSSDIQ